MSSDLLVSTNSTVIGIYMPLKLYRRSLAITPRAACKSYMRLARRSYQQTYSTRVSQIDSPSEIHLRSNVCWRKGEAVTDGEDEVVDRLLVLHSSVVKSAPRSPHRKVEAIMAEEEVVEAIMAEAIMAEVHVVKAEATMAEATMAEAEVGEGEEALRVEFHWRC